MKKLVLALILLPFLGFSQQDSLFTKDGFFLGMKSEFMDECMKSASTEYLEIGGQKITFYAYCNCMADNIFVEMEMRELESISNESDMISLFTSEKYLPILLNCAEEIPADGNILLTNDSEYSDVQKELGYKTCINEILSDPSSSALLSKEQAASYCHCAIDRIYEKGYTMEQVMQAEDTDSEVFNEIVIQCMMQAMGGNIPLSEEYYTRETTKYQPQDITGNRSKTEVSLSPSGSQNFKIKLTFGEKAAYFLLDTGASDVCISEEFAFELTERGLLSDDDYLGILDYEMANGEFITAEIYSLNSLQIGDFKVNNVTIAVAPEFSLLCGQSLLNKFKSYKIDPVNSTLTLER